MKSMLGSVAVLAALLTGCSGGGSHNDPAPMVPGAAGVVELAGAAFAGAEGTAVQIVLRRSGGTSGSMQVTLSTADQSAVGGLDYTPTTTLVTFPDGATSQALSIALSSDALDESDETFTVNLAGSSLGEMRAATVTIRDTALAGRLELSSAAYSTGESGEAILIGVRRVGGVDGSVSARVATLDGSALAGQDYTAVQTTAAFASGSSTEVLVAIPIINDADAEADESFTVTLSDASGAAVLGLASATVTIVSNDQPAPASGGGKPGTLQFSNTTFNAAESSGTAFITVTRAAGSDGVVSAVLTSTAATAGADVDYVSVMQTVSFAGGDTTSKVVRIGIRDDGSAEDLESFNVTLTSPTGGATLGTPASAAVVIQDNDPPAAPVLTASTTTKRIALSWQAVAGTTAYKLFFNRDGRSGFTQLGSDLPATTLRHSFDVSVHDFNWNAALFRLEACNAAGCSGSSSVSARAGMLQAIGYLKAVGPAAIDADDAFGASVAVSADGTTVAIGVPGEDSNATGSDGDTANDEAAHSGAVYVFTRSSMGWQRQAYLKSSDSQSGDRFGSAVALAADGATLAVGAPGRADASGALFVFARSGTGWSQQAKLLAAESDTADELGAALALSGDGNTLAAAASGEDSAAAATPGDDSALDSGAVYLFTRSSGTWSTAALYLKAANAQAGDRFGAALALSSDGSTLAVGAVGEASADTRINGNQNDNTAPQAGAVYIFTRAGQWAQSAYLKAPNAETKDAFGSSLSLSSSGDTLAVGAPLEDGTELGGREAPGVPPDPDGPLTFQGKCELQGAADRPQVGCDSGAVYIFGRSAASWQPLAFIKRANSNLRSKVDERFGTAVSLSSDAQALAISAPGEDSSARGVGGNDTLDDAPNSGAGYLFIPVARTITEQPPSGPPVTRTVVIWEQQTYIKASNTDANDAAGPDPITSAVHAIALSADASALVMGATGEAGSSATDQNDDAAANAGAAYLY